MKHWHKEVLTYGLIVASFGAAYWFVSILPHDIAPDSPFCGLPHVMAYVAAIVAFGIVIGLGGWFFLWLAGKVHMTAMTLVSHQFEWHKNALFYAFHNREYDPDWHWTEKHPESDGWYWFRADEKSRPFVTRVTVHEDCIESYEFADISQHSGEWSSSPIMGPKK